MRFWSMPGPAGFIDEIQHAIAERLNVAVALPSSAGAPGFEAALLDRLRQRVIETVTVCDGDPVVGQVARALAMTEDVQRVDDLFESAQFAGSEIIHLTGLTEARWREWRQFFSDYDDFSKDRSVDQRPVMIAVLEGMELPAEVTDAVTFRCFRWLGVVSELDVTQYVLQRLGGSQETDGGRLLVASIIARIALGDVELAENLTERTLPEIWNPEAVLQEWAGRRGWFKGTHRHWTKGTVFRLNGREEVHSALAALDDAGGTVRSRVWAAQAAMLLPAIERERMKLIKRARNWLRPPFLLADGERTEDAGDLEIGPLEYHLRRGRAPDEVVGRAVMLREVRNKLAHLETLTVEESLYGGLV